MWLALSASPGQRGCRECSPTPIATRRFTPCASPVVYYTRSRFLIRFSAIALAAGGRPKEFIHAILHATASRLPVFALVVRR